MDGEYNSWAAAAEEALSSKEQVTLGKAAPGESVVNHLTRIGRLSRRAQARQAAIGALFPAARDRLPGVVELALDLLRDASKPVRYEACRALAVALVPATLPILQRILDERIDVPWNGQFVQSRRVIATPSMTMPNVLVGYSKTKNGITKLRPRSSWARRHTAPQVCRPARPSIRLTQR